MTVYFKREESASKVKTTVVKVAEAKAKAPESASNDADKDPFDDDFFKRGDVSNYSNSFTFATIVKVAPEAETKTYCRQFLAAMRSNSGETKKPDYVRIPLEIMTHFQRGYHPDFQNNHQGNVRKLTLGNFGGKTYHDEKHNSNSIGPPDKSQRWV